MYEKLYSASFASQQTYYFADAKYQCFLCKFVLCINLRKCYVDAAKIRFITQPYEYQIRQSVCSTFADGLQCVLCELGKEQAY